MILPFVENTNKKILSILNNPYRVYLLYGEKDIGKYYASRCIASKLLDDENITNYDHAHPGLYVLTSNDHKKPISISEVRNLNDKIWHTTLSSTKQKVIIINRVDNITDSAANALLKNLEDMPKDTTVILTATNLDNVIPTILSRSQPIYCMTDKQNAIDHLVKNYNINQAKSKQYLDISNNKLYMAIRNLSESSYEESKYIHSMASQFLDGDITHRFIIAKSIHDKNLGGEFLSELIYTTGKQSTILYDRLDFVESTIQAVDQMRNNVNVRTILENLALR